MQFATSKTLSLSEYAQELMRNGRRGVRGSGDTYWIQYESAAMMRLPTFSMRLPEAGELRRALWRGAMVVTYMTPPDTDHSPNAHLYVCRRERYDPMKLSRSARRDIRRAQRNLGFGELDWLTLQSNGWAAYKDTRERVGLADGTRARFAERFGDFCRNQGHRVFGAWHGSQLLAFMTVAVVDDWVEIEGSFSSNADLGLCPNDGLAHHVLERFLIQGQSQLVSYGTSSIQIDGNRHGLHIYKQKVGFLAEPVHRAFAIHPLLRPLANRLTFAGLRQLLRLRPKSRLVRKSYGALAQILGENGMLIDSSSNTEHEVALTDSSVRNQL
jgi:hypothetical protein